MSDVLQPGPSETAHDPLGDAIRATIRDAGLRIGVLAALLITVGSWSVVFGLSWLPGLFTGRALGITDKGEHVSVGPRIAASLFAPWLIAEHARTPQLDGFARSVSVLGAAVLIVMLVVIGLGVRALLPTLRSRTIALLVAAVGSAAGLAIASAFVSYRIEDTTTGESFTVTHVSSSLFWIPLLWVVAVGLFSFGIVARLPAPMRVALRNGGAVVALVAVTAAVAFPVVVASWNPINQTGKVDWSYDLAEGLWHWGSGVAGVAVPLAFGANAHLAVGPGPFSPFVATAANPSSVSGVNLRLPELSKYMSAHPNARLTGYAGTGRTAAHVALLVGAGLVLFLFMFAAARATRILGAPRALDGLRHGLLLGLAAFLFLLALKWITTAVIAAHANGAGVEYRWGLDTGPLFQTGVEILALCGLSGLIYAALKPSAYRYPAWRPRLRDALAALWPNEEQLTATEPEPASPRSPTAPVGQVPPEPSARYCSHCGNRLRDGDAFCAHCGVRVPTDVI